MAHAVTLPDLASSAWPHHVVEGGTASRNEEGDVRRVSRVEDERNISMGRSQCNDGGECNRDSRKLRLWEEQTKSHTTEQEKIQRD